MLSLSRRSFDKHLDHINTCPEREPNQQHIAHSEFGMVTCTTRILVQTLYFSRKKYAPILTKTTFVNNHECKEHMKSADIKVSAHGTTRTRNARPAKRIPLCVLPF